MRSQIANGGVDVPSSDVEEITRLYEDGLYLRACDRAARLAPPLEWRGTAARLIGGRLANNVYAPQLAARLHVLAWRHDHTSADAAYFYASRMSQRRGPLAAWRFVKGLPAFPDATPEARSDLLGFQSHLASCYRDFETAGRFLREAEALAPDRAWLWVEKSDFLQKQDAYGDALAAAQRALELRPWYRPAVQSAAHLLQLLNRDEDAIALLTEALSHMECAGVAAQLAQLQTELGRHREALANWETMRALSPWIEPPILQWWEGRMSDARYYCGDLAGAAEHATRAGNPFFEKMASRLASPPADARRVVLPVEFVRQHHMTCAPATLSALSHFWQIPVDHLALAEAICYDGTPDHVERNWVEENGWRAREFRVTWETARALLDLGIPFTLATVETQSAHLQAVIGYDSFRGTLLVRDPYQRVTGEWLAEEFLERYAAHGPRGMALVPGEKASVLDDLDLPDSEFYEHHYRVERALHIHDREAAQRHLETLEGMDPNHRLTLIARRRLAGYDSSLPRQFAVVEELLARYPKNGLFLWIKAAALRDLTRRADYRDFLGQLASKKDSEILFWRQWAEELSHDARQANTAERLILRALHFQPIDADNLRALANLLWNRREFLEATWIYRLSACLREKVEAYSRSYFIAARYQRQTEEALGMLVRQFEQFGRHSGSPVRLLFWALTALNRQPEAFAKLESALALRPEDGELLLFAADAFARCGDRERAAALLVSAEKRAARSARLRAAANIADYACDLPASLGLWRKVLDEDPLALDAHRSVTRLLAETQGRPAAITHLRETCERFSHHVPLHRLWVEWSRSGGGAEMERLLRLLFELDPDDAWARREMALILAGQQRFEEAHAELAIAAALEPHSPYTHATRGRILLHAGRHPEAQEACREALRLSIDEQAPATDLIAASLTFEEKRAALAFMREELIRQVVFGDGLLVFRESAFPVLDPAELLAALREALAARPDLWHAWSAVVLQLTDMNLGDEALQLARQATERFPLLARLWLDLAQVHRARREREAEILPLERALQLSPGWGRASRLLANTYERMGDYRKAREILERAISASPLDAYNHGDLGNTLWHLGETERALSSVETALRIEPGWDDAWGFLRQWSAQVGTPGRAVTLARELTETRAGEARSWFVLAQALGSAALEERLAALERALQLNPRYFEAHDTRAWLLSHAGRFDEALAACAPAAFGGNVPFTLQGRAAWVEAQRANLGAAIAQMQSVVERAPDYYWGWNMLADWLCKTRDFPKALEAAEKMARLAPRSAIPLGYLADVQMKVGKEKDAWDSLRRAFEIDPTYEFAGSQLFEHHLGKNDYQEAERILKLLQMHLPGTRSLLAELKLHCRRVRRDESLALLEKICLAPPGDSFAVTAADELLRKAGWTLSAERVFFASLKTPGANPEVGACWARRFAERSAWKYRKELYKLDPLAPIGVRARIAYIETLGNLKKPGYLRSLIRRERAWLLEHAPAWGSVGYSYVQMRRYRAALHWLQSRQNRPDAQPWMLQNLALALRRVGRDKEAIAVNQRAIELRPDHTTPIHRVWLLFEIALHGEHVRATGLLNEIHEHDLAPYNRAILALIRSTLAVFNAPRDQKSSAFRAERLKLRATDLQNNFRENALHRAYRRALKVMGRAAGRPLLGAFYSWLPLKRTAQRNSASPVISISTLFTHAFWLFLVLLFFLTKSCGSMTHP